MLIWVLIFRLTGFVDIDSCNLRQEVLVRPFYVLCRNQCDITKQDIRILGSPIGEAAKSTHQEVGARNN